LEGNFEGALGLLLGEKKEEPEVVEIGEKMEEVERK